MITSFRERIGAIANYVASGICGYFNINNAILSLVWIFFEIIIKFIDNYYTI